MKNTIYNAIQKQLVIDDSDSSISYRKSDIDTEYSVKIFDIEQLYRMFVNGHDIFQCDTTGSITVIFQDGAELPLNFAGIYNKSNPVMLKLTNDMLTDSGNDVIIGLEENFYIRTAISWLYVNGGIKNVCLFPQDKIFADVKDAKQDINGYENTQYILKQSSINYNYHTYAAEYANETSITLNDKSKYQAYIPALGQLLLIHQYKDMINHISEYFGFNNLSEYTAWSSTEADVMNTWCINLGTFPITRKTPKTYIINMMPLFHKM